MKHILWFILGLVSPGVSWASCGMDVCEMNNGSQTNGGPFSITADVRTTTVGQNAHYVESMVGGIFAFLDKFKVGTRVPLVWVNQNESSSTGVGNVVFFGTAHLLKPNDDKAIQMGLQIEAPTVSNDALGDGHLLLLPTVQLSWTPKKTILSGIVGWARVMDGDHNHRNDSHSHHAHNHGDSQPNDHHGLEQSIVNPHAQSELLLRFDAGYEWSVTNAQLHTTVRADGTQELDPESPGNFILSTGPTIGLTYRTITAELSSLFSVSKTKRYTNRTGLRMRFLLP